MTGIPSQSAEDYLERIHELIESKGTAHVADIAQSLGSESLALQVWCKNWPMRAISIMRNIAPFTLTDSGRSIAKRIRDRHKALAEFFTLLDLDDKTQARDIEGIEHHLSSETLDTFCRLSEFFRQNQRCLNSSNLNAPLIRTFPSAEKILDRY